MISKIKSLIKDNPRYEYRFISCFERGRDHLGEQWIDQESINPCPKNGYVKESYLIRVKFGFHEETYDKLLLLSNEQKVSSAEIVRRALSLYVF